MAERAHVDRRGFWKVFWNALKIIAGSFLVFWVFFCMSKCCDVVDAHSRAEEQALQAKLLKDDPALKLAHVGVWIPEHNERDAIAYKILPSNVLIFYDDNGEMITATNWSLKVSIK